MQVKKDEQGRNIINDYYTYLATATALAAGASFTSIVSVEADANFTLVKMACMADIAGAAQTDSSRVIPLVTVSLVDSGSGRNLQSAPIPIDSISGRGALPFILPVPRQFKARSNLSVTFTNYSAATTYANVQLSLIGYKTFYL